MMKLYTINRVFTTSAKTLAEAVESFKKQYPNQQVDDVLVKLN